MRDSEIQIMRKVCRDIQSNPYFCQSLKKNLKAKSVQMAMQGWIFLQEDCGIAMRKHPLT